MIDPDDMLSIYKESAGKLYRQALYYDQIAARFRLGGSNPETARAVAASLSKCADDMRFVFQQMTKRIPAGLRDEIVDEALLRHERGYEKG